MGFPGLSTKPILVAKPTVGVIKALPAHLLPPEAMSDAKNVNFDCGQFYLREGYEKITTDTVAGGRIQFLMQYFHPTHNRTDVLIAVTTGAVEFYNKATDLWHAITPAGYAGGAIGQWDSVVRGDSNPLFFTTGPLNTPWKYEGGAVAEVLGGINAVDPISGVAVGIQSALCLKWYRYHLLLGYVHDSSGWQANRIYWSDNGDPEEWRSGIIDVDTGQTSEAGYMDLFSEDKLHGEGIRAMEMLGELLYVYTGKSICALQHVGYPYIYIFRVVNPTVGAQKNGVCNFGNRHVFMGGDAQVYAFNGVDIQNVSDAAVTDWFALRRFGFINTVALHNPDRALFFYATTDGAEPVEAMEFNLRSGAWSIHDYPFTAALWANINAIKTTATGAADLRWADATGAWTAHTEAWNSLASAGSEPGTVGWREFMGDASGNVYHRYGWTKDGAAYTGYAVTPLFDWGDPRPVKAIMAMVAAANKLPLAYTSSRTYAAAQYALSVYVAGKMSVNEADSWTGPYNLMLDPTGRADECADMREMWRYAKFKFTITSTAATNTPFAVGSYAPYAKNAGLR